MENLSASSPDCTPGHALRRSAYGLGVLFMVVGVCHGPALFDGFFFDDHWHQQELARGGWDGSTLFRATTIEPARFMGHWWQDHLVRWEYVRPAAVAFQKAAHDVFAGDPVGQHAASIGLHWLCAVLVWRLCFVLTGHVHWSLVGALLFAAYPHSVFAVGWLAAQNTLLQTAWMLGAVLWYIRASSLGPLLHEDGTRNGAGATGNTAPPMRKWAAAGVVICWFFALLSRENAIVLPLILVAFDWAFGGAGWVRRRASYHVTLILMMCVFAVWRVSLGGDPMPPVYCRLPDGAGYLAWCVAKLFHYLACTVFPTPMVIGPTGRYDPMGQAPADVVITVLIVAAAGGLYWHATRGIRGAWIWPLWILLSLLPVVPVLATSHSGYVCGAALAIGLILGPARDASQGGGQRKLRRRLPAYAAMAFFVASACGIKISRLQWNGVIQAERFTIAAIADEPAPPETTDVFFVNLPFVNVYAGLSLQEVWGDRADALRCHALTYSPDLIRAAAESVVEQLDDHRFAVSVSGRPYFSGLLGRFLIDAMRGGALLGEGEVIDAGAYRVTVAKATSEGVSKLIFAFDRPLSDPRNRFYVCSRQRGATRLRFEASPRSPTGNERGNQAQQIPVDLASTSVEDVEAAAAKLRDGRAKAGSTLLLMTHAADADVADQAWRHFAEAARAPAEAVASPIQRFLTVDRPDVETVERVQAWWRAFVDDRLLVEVARDRERLAAIAHERDELERGRALLGRFVQLDLFLTGKPFPGPR